VGISLGDLGLAYQAFKVAVSIDPNHGEALNNIAVLEMRRQKFEVAKACLSTSCEVSPHIFEPFYNSGTLHTRSQFEHSLVRPVSSASRAFHWETRCCSYDAL
jgi:tetratricopeptide repeat protein 8